MFVLTLLVERRCRVLVGLFDYPHAMITLLDPDPVATLRAKRVCSGHTSALLAAEHATLAGDMDERQVLGEIHWMGTRSSTPLHAHASTRSVAPWRGARDTSIGAERVQSGAR